MATNEDTVLSQYVPGFRANLNLAPQQTDTRLLGRVDGDLTYDTPGQMFNADDVQRTSDPEIIVTRVPDTPDKFPGFTRRVGVVPCPSRTPGVARQRRQGPRAGRSDQQGDGVRSPPVAWRFDRRQGDPGHDRRHRPGQLPAQHPA